jgi:hypothetical protein
MCCWEISPFLSRFVLTLQKLYFFRTKVAINKRIMSSIVLKQTCIACLLLLLFSVAHADSVLSIVNDLMHSADHRDDDDRLLPQSNNDAARDGQLSNGRFRYGPVPDSIIRSIRREFPSPCLQGEDDHGAHRIEYCWERRVTRVPLNETSSSKPLGDVRHGEPHGLTVLARFDQSKHVYTAAGSSILLHMDGGDACLETLFETIHYTATIVFRCHTNAPSNIEWATRVDGPPRCVAFITLFSIAACQWISET